MFFQAFLNVDVRVHVLSHHCVYFHDRKSISPVCVSHLTVGAVRVGGARRAVVLQETARERRGEAQSQVRSGYEKRMGEGVLKYENISTLKSQVVYSRIHLVGST